MLEQRIDILSERVMSKANAICFTSNGVVKNNGRLVMGAGVAKAFRDTFPGLDLKAGQLVKKRGNICQIVDPGSGKPLIVAFPTKHNWRDPSELSLIRESAKELMHLTEVYKWNLVALPRPGCSNGGLDWATVKAELAQILDDRVVIVTY